MAENLCPQCGAPLAPGATECKYCGEAVAPAQVQPQPQPQPQYQQQGAYGQPGQPVQVFVQTGDNDGIDPSWPVKSKITAGLLAGHPQVLSGQNRYGYSVSAALLDIHSRHRWSGRGYHVSVLR